MTAPPTEITVVLGTLRPPFSLTAGQAIRLHIHDTCNSDGDYGAYGDLLKACYIVHQLAEAIDFGSFAYGRDDANPDPKAGIITLTGVVRHAPAAAKTLLELVVLTSDDTEAVLDAWDDVHELAGLLHDDHWKSDDCPLKELFRAATVELFLYVAKDAEAPWKERQDAMTRLLELEPQLKDDQDFVSQFSDLIK